MKEYRVVIGTFMRGRYRNTGSTIKLTEDQAAGYIKEGLVVDVEEEATAKADAEKAEKAEKPAKAKKDA